MDFKDNDEDDLDVLKIIEVGFPRAVYVRQNNAVASINQILIVLRIYATGQHLLSVGDFVGVHISIVSRIIRKMSEAIANL
ncbi:hypothetical protein FQA39_LY14689 [Lamprigera yunnana]|nr:hypothetical protein FQA39_LY14689 [Lamprigera yunnana]